MLLELDLPPDRQHLPERSLQTCSLGYLSSFHPRVVLRCSLSPPASQLRPPGASAQLRRRPPEGLPGTHAAREAEDRIAEDRSDLGLMAREAGAGRKTRTSRPSSSGRASRRTRSPSWRGKRASGKDMESDSAQVGSFVFVFVPCQAIASDALYFLLISYA